MKLSVWAYEKDQYWLIDVIDTAKGKGYCRSQWIKYWDNKEQQ